MEIIQPIDSLEIIARILDERKMYEYSFMVRSTLYMPKDMRLENNDILSHIYSVLNIETNYDRAKMISEYKALHNL
jgi:hypothetical protein